MKCDIIIPVWNELELTRACIESLKKNTRYPYRLIIVDNGSEPATENYLKGLKNEFEDFLLIRNTKNLGFVKAVNQGFVSSENPYICVLNNDTAAHDSWLLLLVKIAEISGANIGIVNPASNIFGKNSPDGNELEWQELDTARGFCMLIKREVIDKIGLFDVAYGIGYFEEKDFSRRARNVGYVCARAKASFVYHKDRASFDKIEARDEIFKRNEAIYRKKWGRALNLAVIAENAAEVRGKTDMIYALLEKGHRVNIFTSDKNVLKALKDHMEIRFIKRSRIFPALSVIFKLWERKKKKKIDLIVAPDKKTREIMKRFCGVHGAIVPEGADDDIVRLCEEISRRERQ